MVKFESNVRVNLESDLGEEFYTKVVGLKTLYVSYFQALAKFCPELELSKGQTEPNMGLN